MKKLLCSVLAAVLCLGSVSAMADVEGTVQGDIMLTSETGAEASAPAAEPSSSAEEKSGPVFSDVVSGSVLDEAVNKLVEKKILAGYPDGTFRPNAGLTRAELSKVINLVFNLTEKSTSVPFKDVTKDDWYYDYVSVAVKSGYIKGFQDNTFRGDDSVTREQVCAIINRVTKEQGIGLFELPFTDNITDAVSDWALEDVKKIIASNVMPLEADGKFRATENITRAELVLAVETFVIELPKFTVNFETNGGSDIKEVVVEQGSLLTKPADPEKKNNTFGGWFTDKTFKKPYDFNTFVSGDFTLYAKWTPNATVGVGTGGGSYSSTTTPTTPTNPTDPDDPAPTPQVKMYTVTFYDEEDSLILGTQEVASGECAVEPEIPVKELRDFIEWCTDKKCTQPYDFSTPVTKNITLYVKWNDTKQVIADLNVIKQVMAENPFESVLGGIIMDLTLETIDFVIADGEAGNDISGEYVADVYGDRILEAKAMYDEGMDPQEKKKSLKLQLLKELENVS